MTTWNHKQRRRLPVLRPLLLSRLSYTVITAILPCRQCLSFLHLVHRILAWALLRTRALLPPTLPQRHAISEALYSYMCVYHTRRNTH